MMKKNNPAKIILILLILTFAQNVAEGQNPDSIVWAGDVNNNGIVNNFDILYLGAAYNLEGSPRDFVSIAWEAQEVPQNWPISGDGSNAAFADCNGDGFIDDADLQAIEVNYGLSHDSVFSDTFLMADEIGDTEISFDTMNSSVQVFPGETFEFPINLGDGNSVIENFYGLAFRIDVNTDFIDLSSVSFTVDSTWINSGNSTGLLSVQKKNFTDNTLDVAISRKNMGTTEGSGAIGYLTFIIEDNVPTFAPDTEVLTFRETRVLDNSLKEIYFVDERALLLDITNRTDDGLLRSNFSIRPNPANNGICFIEGLENHPHAKVRLLDMLGREMDTNFSDGSFNINHLPSGVYFINIKTHKGQITEKVIINN